jgi:CCR4-NOT transcription complex subunit 2
MNSFGVQQNARQTPRLQNTQKTGLGNGNAGANWAFGAPSSFGGLPGSAPGLTARPGQLSGFAQVMGGGGGQGPIDMSDFPTLSGAPRAQPLPPASSGAGTWNSSAIRQPTSGQQQGQIQQPRAPSTAPSHQSLDQQSASFRKNPNFGSPGQTQAQPTGQQSTSLNSKPWSELSESDRAGMAGLEAMFRYRDDRANGQSGDQTLPQKQKTQAMLMGHDLSSAALGLDLESSEPLYPTFSVFGDLYDGSESSLAQRRPIPDFPLSESYNVTNVPSLLPRMSSMSDGK